MNAARKTLKRQHVRGVERGDCFKVVVSERQGAVGMALWQCQSLIPTAPSVSFGTLSIRVWSARLVISHYSPSLSHRWTRRPHSSSPPLPLQRLPHTVSAVDGGQGRNATHSPVAISTWWSWLPLVPMFVPRPTLDHLQPDSTRAPSRRPCGEENGLATRGSAALERKWPCLAFAAALHASGHLHSASPFLHHPPLIARSRTPPDLPRARPRPHKQANVRCKDLLSGYVSTQMAFVFGVLTCTERERELVALQSKSAPLNAHPCEAGMRTRWRLAMHRSATLAREWPLTSCLSFPCCLMPARPFASPTSPPPFEFLPWVNSSGRARPGPACQRDQQAEREGARTDRITEQLLLREAIGPRSTGWQPQPSVGTACSLPPLAVLPPPVTHHTSPSVTTIRHRIPSPRRCPDSRCAPTKKHLPLTSWTLRSVRTPNLLATPRSLSTNSLPPVAFVMYIPCALDHMTQISNIL
ncbi:unnamed protein product, partial [Rhizoctonia solani]